MAMIMNKLKEGAINKKGMEVKTNEKYEKKKHNKKMTVRIGCTTVIVSADENDMVLLN